MPPAARRGKAISPIHCRGFCERRNTTTPAPINVPVIGKMFSYSSDDESRRDGSP